MGVPVVVPSHTRSRAGWDSGQSGLVVVNQPLHGLTAPAHRASSKGFGGLKGHLIAPHIVAGPCQCMRHRLERHHPVGLVLLPLIIAFDLARSEEHTSEL